MAALNCVSEKTLHLYQRRGIVEPRYVDSQTGYRYYGLDQCSTLDAVSQLKALGFSLVEIEGLLKQTDVDGLQERLAVQMAEIERQERELAMAKSMARHLLDACAVVKGTIICDQIMLEVLPERRALIVDVPPVSPDDVENHQWEYAVRAAKRDLADRGFPMSLFQNVSGIVSEEDLRRGTFVTRRAAIFLSDELADLLESAAICATYTVPGGQYLTMYYDHSFIEGGLSPEYPGIARMIDYAHAKGLEIAGDYIGETLACTPLFGFEGRDAAFKMCLPVKIAR